MSLSYDYKNQSCILYILLGIIIFTRNNLDGIYVFVNKIKFTFAKLKTIKDTCIARAYLQPIPLGDITMQSLHEEGTTRSWYISFGVRNKRKKNTNN